MNLKKRVLIALMFLVLVPLSFAGDDWMYNSRDLTMDVDIGSNVEVVPLQSNYKIEYVQANLSLYPREGKRQDVLTLKTEPEAAEKADSMVFKWENPETNTMQFSVNSRVNVKNELVEVKNKINFPIETLPADIRQYTKTQENIDSDNPEIIKLASSLVEGENDLYIVVGKLAEWTETNVEYSLTTTTESASQPASWVLKNRYGVCDEITSLFIALCRSLGIPARYVSGVAYTTFQEKNNWGPHAWAEVYFPGYGWVPYDITYKELGFVDPTHITLKYSFDSDESSTIYESYGTNIELKTKELNIETRLIESNSRVLPSVSLSADAVKKSIRPGSHNLIEVEVENLKDCYLTTTISLATVEKMEIIGENTKHVLLEPFQTKKEYYIVKIDKDLKKGYTYTFPVQAYTVTNTTSKTSFRVERNEPFYSLDDIQRLLGSLNEEEEKSYSKEIKFNCQIDGNIYYLGEKAEIDCTIENRGNVFLEDINVCFADECQIIDLGIAQEKAFHFEWRFNGPLDKKLAITAESKDVSKTVFLDVTVSDAPRINITEIEMPESVSYDDQFSVSFKLKKVSESTPKDVEVTFRNGYPQKWSVEELEDDEVLEVDLKGSDLRAGDNKITISVDYKDDRDKVYKTTEETTIKLEKVSFGQQIAIFFKSIGKWFMGLFS